MTGTEDLRGGKLEEEEAVGEGGTADIDPVGREFEICNSLTGQRTYVA